MQQGPDLEIASDHPLYNIGVVTRMTGISIATLRAWERRYGFPQAGRTEGGHRLYSESDVVRLRWVKTQIDQGMQTAQAIRALHYREATERLAVEKAQSPAQPAVDPSRLAVHRDRLVQALLQHDTVQADQILGDALPVFQPEGLILDMIGPAMAAIGDAWHNREISVATEHLATNYLRQRLLMWASGPPAYTMQPLILACAPGELHEGGLLMLGALLRRRRWPVAYLGQTVPLPDLAALVRELMPPLVVLAATTEDTASALVEWPHWLPEAAQTGRPVIGFAGRIFTEQAQWRTRVAGAFLGSTIGDALETIERLLR